MSHPALSLTKLLSKQYPGIWDQADRIRQGKGKNLPDWDDRCYLPMSKFLPITSMNDSLACLMAALASWRVSKEIYRFDPDLEILLYDQADVAIKVPCAVFDTLPFRCIYIESPQLDENVQGFFVHFEYDITKKRLKLRLLVLYEGCNLRGGWIPLILRLDCETVAESMKVLQEDGAQKELSSLVSVFGSEKAEQIMKALRDSETVEWLNEPMNQALKIVSNTLFGASHVIARAIQLVLYICAKNAEVQENKSYTSKRTKKILDHGMEIRRWDVGLRIGRIIREGKKAENRHYENSAAVAIREGRSMRPHPRRGHFHPYWIGRKSVPVERKIILKWVAPTYVGIPDAADPAVVNIMR